MLQLSLKDLISDAASIDAAAASTPDVDRFCSSAAWTSASLATQAYVGEPAFFRSAAGFALLWRIDDPRIGKILLTAAAPWCFASGLIGPDPKALADDLLAPLLQAEDPDGLLLTGIVPGSDLDEHCSRVISEHGLKSGRETDLVVRMRADLSQGYQRWHDRRTRRFRAELRRLGRRSSEAGVRWEIHDGKMSVDTSLRLFERLVRMDHHTWKGRAEEGFSEPPLIDFYADLVGSLGPQGRLTVTLATLGSEDVAYLFGGRLGDDFRGFQHGYHHEHPRLGLGSLIHTRSMERLASRGVNTYDLGMHMEWKERFSDRILYTKTLIGEKHGRSLLFPPPTDPS